MLCIYNTAIFSYGDTVEGKKIQGADLELMALEESMKILLIKDQYTLI